MSDLSNGKASFYLCLQQAQFYGRQLIVETLDPKQNQRYEQLDPLTTLAQLALLSFYPSKTKVGVDKDYGLIYYPGDDFYQGVRRMLLRDSYTSWNPIFKALSSLSKYLSKHPHQEHPYAKILLVFDRAILALQETQKLYSSNTLFVHALQQMKESLEKDLNYIKSLPREAGGGEEGKKSTGDKKKGKAAKEHTPPAAKLSCSEALEKGYTIPQNFQALFEEGSIASQQKYLQSLDFVSLDYSEALVYKDWEEKELNELQQLFVSLVDKESEAKHSPDGSPLQQEKSTQIEAVNARLRRIAHEHFSKSFPKDLSC